MVVGVFIRCENNFRKKAEYIFNQMFSVLGIPYQILSDMHDADENVHHLIISYGAYILEDYPNKCIINIFHEDTNGKNNEWYHQLYESQPPEVSYIFTQTNNKIPYLYSHVAFDPSKGGTLCEYANGKSNVAVQSIETERGLIINIGFDLVKSAFFLLSREEELMCNEQDIYNRFSAKFSVACKNDFIFIPVVDEYIKILNELIALGFEKLKIPLIQKCLWPQNKDFAVCLTHDVDRIKKWTNERIISQFISSGILLFKLEIKQSVNKLAPLILPLLKQCDPYWTFEEIQIAEDEYGFKSSFYFCASGNHKIDPGYNIHTKKIKRLISDIYKRGCEVGLHGSFDSYNDYELLSKEKQLMEEFTGLEIVGIRQHYLRFKYPDTWRLQEKIGLKYDTTLGYADTIGFRASTTFPFYPYDLQRNKVINILEISLTIMDDTFKSYSKVAPKDAFIQIKKVLETVEKISGVATLLWHNNVFDNEENPGWGEVYHKSLEYLAGENAWVTSGKEITEWWIARDGLKCTDVEITKNKSKWSFRAEIDIESIWFKISGLNDKDDVSVEGAKGYKIRNTNNATYLEIENISKGNAFTIIASTNRLKQIGGSK